MSDQLNEQLLLQRVKDLEDQVTALQTTSTSLRSGGTPPKPLGMAATTQPGIVAVEWDAVAIGDLLYYEVDVATDANFTDAERFTSTNPYYVYYGGLAAVTYYFRVRAVNRNTEAGGWGATVSTAVGEVGSDLLDSGVNSDLDNAKQASERFQAYFYTKTTSFTTIQTGSGTELTEYGPLNVYVPDRVGATVAIWVYINGQLDVQFPGSSNTNWMKLDLRRTTEDGTHSSVFLVQRDYSYARGGSGTSGDLEYISYPAYLEQPTPGYYEYYIEHSVGRSGGSNQITFTGNEVKINALVFS